LGDGRLPRSRRLRNASNGLSSLPRCAESRAAQVKFQGRSLTVTLPAEASVADLKRSLEGETRVLSKRQKLLGLKPLLGGGLVSDDTLLAACVPPKCVMLMGCVHRRQPL